FCCLFSLLCPVLSFFYFFYFFSFFIFFFFNDTATTDIYTLSLHDALPILLVYVKYSSVTIILHFPALYFCILSLLPRYHLVPCILLKQSKTRELFKYIVK